MIKHAEVRFNIAYDDTSLDLRKVRFTFSHPAYDPRWRDLQTQWQPSTFAWRLVRYRRRPGWCGCMGPITEDQKRANLCACAWDELYGVQKWERILVR